MPPPPRFLHHLPATPTEVAESPPHAAASAAPRPAHWDGTTGPAAFKAATMPHQPLRVQHTGTVLILVPRRPEPPVHFPGPLQPELQQPQQAQRHPLRLAGPLDRVLGPGPALLPPQPLLQVAEPVLLPEPGGEQLRHLQPRQVHGRGHQGEPLLIPLDLRHDRLDRHLPSQDPPQADDLLPADLPPAAVDDGGAGPPTPLPEAAPAGRGQPPAPLRLRPRPPR